MLKILISGEFKINKSPVHIVIGGVFLVYLLATIFSLYRYGSFWGVSQQASESMITIGCLLFFYFLINSIFSKIDIFISLIVFSFSAVIAELIGILQLFGVFIIPFGFTKSTIFNLTGSTGSLGFFVAILLPLVIALLVVSKKWWKILFILQIVISTFIIFIVNYPIIWWVVAIGSALILILGIQRKDLLDGRWMALPMFFLSVSLFFVFLNPQISWLPQKVAEVSLSQNTGLDLAIQAIKEKPILGSGLGTFVYDFSKFKNPDFNKSSIWNATFNKSSSKVLNSLATTGVFGFLIMLLLMVLPIFYGIRFLIFKKDNGDVGIYRGSADRVYSILLLGLVVMITEQNIAYFLYNSNVVLDFVYFFAIASLVGIIFENKRNFVLKLSSTLNLIVTFIFILFFTFGMGVLMLYGQKYLAEVNYYRGLFDYQSGQKVDGLKKLESAASLNPKSDLYFRQLSQAYLLGLQDELQNTKSITQGTIADQEKTKIQNFMGNSVNAGKVATDLNPQDSSNWSSRGYVYQNLIGILPDAGTWAINSYDSALKLDPNDPYLFYQEGNVYLTEAQSVSGDAQSKLLLQAQGQLEKAVSLNPNYSDALYSLGIVYNSLGQANKAIDIFVELQKLNPTNQDVSRILTNLENGKITAKVATPSVKKSKNSTENAVKNP